MIFTLDVILRGWLSDSQAEIWCIILNIFIFNEVFPLG